MTHAWLAGAKSTGTGLTRRRRGATVAVPVQVVPRRLGGGGVGRRLAQRFGLARQPVLLILGIRVDLVVTLSRSKELLHQVAPGDVGWLCKQVLDIVVEVPKPTLGDGVRDVVDRARHVRQRSLLLLLRVARLDGELGQQGDLEVVEVFVVSRQLPPLAVLELGFDNKPVLVFRKAVLRNLSRNGREQLPSALESAILVVIRVTGVLRVVGLVARRLSGLLALERENTPSAYLQCGDARHLDPLALTYAPF